MVEEFTGKAVRAMIRVVVENIVLFFLPMAVYVIYVLLTLASDIANAWLDPRIRVS